MKIEQFKTDKDKLVISAEIPNKRGIEYIGTLKPQKGHTLFEMNVVTQEIVIAKFEDIVIDFNSALKGNYSKKQKVIINPNCIYVTALNKKNAAKKFLEKMYQIYLHTQNK